MDLFIFICVFHLQPRGHDVYMDMATRINNYANTFSVQSKTLRLDRMHFPEHLHFKAIGSASATSLCIKQRRGDLIRGCLQSEQNRQDV